jgi:hypothetical protein
MNQHSIILLLLLVIVILAIYLAINHSGGEQFRRRGCNCELCWGKGNCPNCGCPDVACEDECL